MKRVAVWAVLAAAAVWSAAFAHNGVDHATPEEAARHAAETADQASAAADTGPGGLFPTGVGGAYALIDHHGRARTERDPAGRAQLIFFGYATCEAICSVALPRMAEAAALLDAKGLEVQPILITVDPRLDTPEAMRARLSDLHPRFLGLTGDAEALAVAQAAFQVEATLLGETPDGAPIYAHGSYVYLMDAEGGFLTLLPPILGPERMADVAEGYLTR